MATLGVEREMKSEFSKMLGRLNSCTGNKVTLLQHDKDVLIDDINAIEAFEQIVDNGN